MTTPILLFLMSYLISVSSASALFLRSGANDDFKKNESLSFRLFIYFLMYAPFFSQIIIFAIFFIGGILITKDFIVERLKIRKKRNEIIKDRNKKIKLGIIKITKNDPYGEEDWTN